jgi:hypothetical protein
VFFAKPETVTDYIEMFGELWFRHPEALAFVRWLFNHSSIMAERALLMKDRFITPTICNSVYFFAFQVIRTKVRLHTYCPIKMSQIY